MTRTLPPKKGRCVQELCCQHQAGTPSWLLSSYSKNTAWIKTKKEFYVFQKSLLVLNFERTVGSDSMRGPCFTKSHVPRCQNRKKQTGQRWICVAFLPMIVYSEIHSVINLQSSVSPHTYILSLQNLQNIDLFTLHNSLVLRSFELTSLPLRQCSVLWD